MRIYVHYNVVLCLCISIYGLDVCLWIPHRASQTAFWELTSILKLCTGANSLRRGYPGEDPLPRRLRHVCALRARLQAGRRVLPLQRRVAAVGRRVTRV